MDENTHSRQLTLDGSIPGSAKRKSYSREKKLLVVKFYHENDNNLYQTCKKFSLNSKTVLRWIRDKKKIKKSSKGSKRVKFGRTAQYPEMEERLYSEYKEMREKGLKVKGWWFRVRSKQLHKDLYSDREEFSCSEGWFSRFKRRHKISLRRATNTCQRPPDDKRTSMQKFHQSIRKAAKTGESAGPLGRWKLSSIANMDQTPLPFSFTAGEMYSDTGERSVWVRSGQSGLDKRQCTAQLTLFADGEPRVKPLVIFRGTGKRIAFTEQVRYDKRVTVRFQPNAWCDENVMGFWIRQCWKPVCSGPMHLVMDVHKAQKTDAIQDLLAKDCNTHCSYVPGGCTSLVQPVDVSFNKPFKAAIEKLSQQHLHDNLDMYVRGGFSASARRILFTQWIGQAWEELSSKKEMIIRSFEKCGLSVAVDGSEDDKINIEGIDEYSIPDEEDDESDDEDPFATTDDDSS